MKQMNEKSAALILEIKQMTYDNEKVQEKPKKRGDIIQVLEREARKKNIIRKGLCKNLEGQTYV